MTDGQKLLLDYAQNGSETAFRQIVDGYIDLVYSTAFRLVDRDAHLAQDVTQGVFADLARMAPRLAPEVMLGGWLHRHACFVARNTMRSERRRRAREQKALEMNALSDSSSPEAYAEIAPLLDQAIDQLGALDRAAIVLRFFEQKDLRSVGVVLGTSENTARMRVSRALEKLHALLRRRGIVSSAVVLETVLATNSVTAAPGGLASTIAGSALLSLAAGPGTTLTLLKIMTLTKLKLSILGAVAVAGVSVSLLIVNQARGKMREQDEMSRQQGERLARLSSENARLSNLLAEATPFTGGGSAVDLANLRAQAESLRRRTNDLVRAQEKKRSVPRQVSSRPLTPLEEKEENIEKINSARNWGFALLMYANEHEGKFPSTMEEADQFLPGELRGEAVAKKDQFEYVPPPSAQDVKKPSETIAIREKAARKLANGKWAKAYGFLDGHGELHSEADGNFDDFEQAHGVPASTP
jgi:RNA polymerase sigma factor (sigma-70 family)